MLNQESNSKVVLKGSRGTSRIPVDVKKCKSHEVERTVPKAQLWEEMELLKKRKV